MSDQLQHEREERLLNLAAMACQAQEDEDFEAFLNSDEYVPPDPEWVEKMEKELRTPPKRRIPLVRYLVAAALVVVVALMVSVSANPKGLGRTHNQDYSRYSQVSLDDGVVLEKPEGWQSEYYPTWAPSGFSVAFTGESGKANTLTLSNKQNACIEFTVYENEIYKFPNTEELTPLSVKIFDEEHIAYLSEDGLHVLITVQNNGSSIVIDGGITPEEMVKIVENIKNIN